MAGSIQRGAGSQDAGTSLPTPAVDWANNLHADIVGLWNAVTVALGSIGGTANAITAVGAVPIPSYVTGMSFSFVAGSDNTGAASINIDAIGVVDIVDEYGTALVGGEIVDDALHIIRYDGTDFRLQPLRRARVESLVIAASDETTALTTGTAKVTFRMPYAMRLLAGAAGIKASLSTAQASGNIFTVDVNDGGTTILSTKITIDNTEKTSITALAPPVLSDVDLAADAEITIDIDQIGNGSAKGLKVTLIGRPR